MTSQKFTTQNAEETRKLGEKIARSLSGGEVLALYGELGSGKTTFVQGLARGLGIKKRVLSPSFTLIKQYKISPPRCNTLYHIDLYRIENEKDADGLGLKEIWSDPKNICVIEWAEKIKKILPKERWEIHFEYLSENVRQIVIKKPFLGSSSQGQSLHEDSPC